MIGAYCSYFPRELAMAIGAMKQSPHLHREICDHFEDVLVCIEEEEAAVLFTRCDL